MGASDEELAAVLYVAPEASATQERMAGLVGYDPTLVLVDAAAGAYDLQQLDDNKRGDVERFTRLYVTTFWRAGIATIVLDHVVKNADNRGNYAIGSERKVGGADVHLGFSVVHPIKRGAKGVYKITTHKDRGGFLKRGKLCDFELDSDENHALSWSFVPATEVDEEHPFRPTHLMEKVSRYVEMQPEPVTMTVIKEAVTGKGEFIVEAVNILVSDGFLEESVGARSARLLTSLIAYREEHDSPVPDPFPPVPEMGHSTRSPDIPLLRRGMGDGDDLENGNGSQRSLDDDIPF